MYDYTLPYLFVGYVVGICVVVSIAKAKNRSQISAFGFALFFTPVMAYLYYLAVPAISEKHYLEVK